MENRSHALLAGLFVLLLGACAVAALWWFGGKREPTDEYVVVTRKNISGLNLQAQVRYRGVRVGKVESIELDASDMATTLIRISVARNIPVTHGTTAKLGFQGVTGIAHVLLEESGKDARPLLPGSGEDSRIPMQNSLIEDFSEVGGQTLRNARDFLANANDVLSPENRQAISRTLANLEAVSAESRVVVQQLHEALSAPNIRLMSSTLQHLDRATAQAAPLLADTRALVTRLQGVSDRIDTALAEQSGGNGLIPRLNDLSADLSSSSRQLNRVLQMLEDSPQSLIFGRPKALPGPGEPGFVVPAGAGGTP
jgi:phospholipid/cholesterol/gamma-HCH transport system substrate-binding protein